MIRVLVTGAGGFVGKILCPRLVQAGYLVRAAMRTPGPDRSGATESVVVGDIGGSTDWSQALRGVDMVIHLAARVHVMNDVGDSTSLYLETNARGTERLAVDAARTGVCRFIYLSSVKVNGEETSDRVYSAADVPQPLDAYGRSKWLGEQSLAETAARAGLPAEVVRSPLVYGPGVRANFLRLLRWVDRERLLPFGGIRNQRSLVSVWNLCDLIAHLLDHPAGTNHTWMVSDGQDISTPELVRRIAQPMGRRARLVPVPALLLRLGGGLTGYGAEMRRLCGSLTVDITPTRRLLGWSPPMSMEDALVSTVTWYRSQNVGGPQ